MAKKKKFKMILPFQDDPLFEERRRLVDKSWSLVFMITFLRKRLGVAEFLESNAKSDISKNLAIKQRDKIRAELAVKEMEMARTNAAIGKLNKELKSHGEPLVHVEEVAKFE